MDEHITDLRYSMILQWDPRDDIFVVTVPELPGCRTHGKTYEEAVTQGREVIEGWIAAARSWGDPIPPPRFYTDEAKAVEHDHVRVS